MSIWGFLEAVAKRAASVPGTLRRWARENRKEIEETYEKELDTLREELKEPGEEEERALIRKEIKRVLEQKRNFHRASRELLLSRSLVERMTPKGAISPGHPTLGPAQQETLRLAAGVLEELEPAESFSQHFLRGNALYTAGDFAGALSAYDAALRLRPDDPDTLYNRGNTLRNLKRYEEALADYNRALELRPDDADTLNNRGVTLRHLERYEEALADHNRSLDLRPDDPTTLHNRGVTLRNLKRYEEALADYNRALEIQPDDPGTLLSRGITLAHLKRYDEALADFNRSLELRPGHPNTTYDLACLFSLMGRLEEALKNLRDAISRDPQYRTKARDDGDFENLRSDPVLGPEFERLVVDPDQPGP